MKRLETMNLNGLPDNPTGVREVRLAPRQRSDTSWVILLALLLFLPGHPVLQAQGVGDLRALSGTLETLSESVSLTVVQIFATGYRTGQGVVPSSGDLVARQRGSGSGVILDPSGYVVTNAHVVANASQIVVELPLSDREANGQSVLQPRGHTVKAQLVGVDRETDLAVLKLQVDHDLPYLELGDSEALQPGQLVTAFGSPLGLNNSVSLGIVSAVARQLRPDDPMIYIQTDAAINAGNSGGPLVDLDGRVVGINTFIYSQSGGSEGIGFAVPSNIVQAVYQQIRQYGRVRRGEIGARAQTITPALAGGLGLPQDWGVVLADVCPSSPADTAGLRVGDIVLSLDGKTMENARQFQVNVYQRRAGQAVNLELLRGDARLNYSVALIERPGDPDRFQEMVRPAEHLVPKLGILALNLTPDVMVMLPALRQPRGVVVAVSAAAHVRGESLLPGDVIHALNKRPVGSMLGLRTHLEPLGSGDAAVLQVERSGRLLYVTVILD